MKKTFLSFAALMLALLMLLPALPASAGRTVWGDADGDGSVTSADLLTLRKYFALFDYTSGTSSVVLAAGGDCDGNGGVSTSDLILLRKYFAEFDYNTGTSPVVLGPGEPEPEIPDPPAPAPDGTLIYYENFNNRKTSSTTALADLGWTADTTANGAYKNNTTNYSFRDYGGSRQLYLDNNRTNCSDSYAVILTSAQMGRYHEQNYSYQYDVTYLDAGDGKRYIVLGSEYNGPFYNSFHFRNSGYANNQVHKDGEWYTYDVSGSYYCSYQNANSLATKLLGKTFNVNTNAFYGISVSIRYAIDWESGVTVSMRVNTAGYPGSGKWTVVSKSSPSGAAFKYFDRDAGGAALILKTGGKQNGYVDNILVWTGTGDAPTDLSSPLVSTSQNNCSGHYYVGSGETCLDPVHCKYCGEVLEGFSGHTFTEFENVRDRCCTTCGAIESNLGSKWLFEDVPSFLGGTYSEATYCCGQAMDDPALPRGSESEMMIVSGTTLGQFNAYQFRLSNYGYEKFYSNTCDGNSYSGYRNENHQIYSYYTAATNTVRVIRDVSSTASPAEFGYTREKAAGETTILYQYGVPMNEFAYGISNSLNKDKKIDCGMMYVIKLADNSVVIVDGGGYQQFDAAEIDGFMRFLRDVTGIPAGQKIRISGWFITHCHSDHLAGFCLFIKKYGPQLSLERMFNNFPSVFSEDATLSGHKSNLSKLITYTDTYLSTDVPFLKLHTGESIQLGEVKFTTLYTHEDLVDPVKATTKIAGDFNNSTTVLKIEFDGKVFMQLGDMNKPAQSVILANYSDKTLKADIVQMAHHVFNDVSSLYRKIQAPVVFVPQAKGGEVSGRHNKNAMNAVKTYAKSNMMFYADQGTYGLAVVNGEVKLVYTKSGVDGKGYTGWSW